MNFISAKDNDVVINLEHVIFFECEMSFMICFHVRDKPNAHWKFKNEDDRDAAYIKLRTQISLTTPINKDDIAWANAGFMPIELSSLVKPKEKEPDPEPTKPISDTRGL